MRGGPAAPTRERDDVVERGRILEDLLLGALQRRPRRLVESGTAFARIHLPRV